jgi:hypothetical protein
MEGKNGPYTLSKRRRTVEILKTWDSRKRRLESTFEPFGRGKAIDAGVTALSSIC